MAGTMMFYLAGAWTESAATMSVTNPYSGKPVGEVYLADAATFAKAIDAAYNTREACARMPIHERARILSTIASGIERDSDKFAQMITWECGRAIRDTRAEVNRAAFTFRTAAEEAKRIA